MSTKIKIIDVITDKDGQLIITLSNDKSYTTCIVHDYYGIFLSKDIYNNSVKQSIITKYTIAPITIGSVWKLIDIENNTPVENIDFEYEKYINKFIYEADKLSSVPSKNITSNFKFSKSTIEENNKLKRIRQDELKEQETIRSLAESERDKESYLSSLFGVKKYSEIEAVLNKETKTIVGLGIAALAISGIGVAVLVKNK